MNTDRDRLHAGIALVIMTLVAASQVAAVAWGLFGPMMRAETMLLDEGSVTGDPEVVPGMEAAPAPSRPWIYLPTVLAVPALPLGAWALARMRRDRLADVAWIRVVVLSGACMLLAIAGPRVLTRIATVYGSGP